MVFYRKLAFKLCLNILSVCLIIFFTIFSINNYISKDLILKNVDESIRNLAFGTSNKIYAYLSSSEKVLQNLAQTLETTQITEKNIHDLIKTTLIGNKEIFGSTIAFEPYSFKSDIQFYAPYYYKEQNELKYKNFSDGEYNYTACDWYTQPKNIGKPLWSEPYFDEGGGDIVMATYSAPFYTIINNEKVFTGVVTADISLNELEKIVSSIKIFKDGYGFIVSKKGTFVTHPRKSFMVKENILKYAKESGDEDIIKNIEKMLMGKEGLCYLKKSVQKQKTWMYYIPIDTTGWSLGIIFPEKGLFADLYDLNKKLLSTAGIGFVLLFLVIILIASRISYPISRLANAAEQVGSGNFDVKLPKIKSKCEISVLRNSFNIMQKELKDYIENLKNTTAAKEKIESELQIAHDIQMGIIPKTFPAFPDRTDFDIFAILEPARAVGGDLYDFFFSEEHLFFAIGDVSGKGIPASLLMAVTRTLWRAKTSIDIKIEDIVESMNHELSSNNEFAMFVTFIMGIMDTKTGEIIYCNAGHNPPFVIRNNGAIERLESRHGVPLGIDINKKYSTGKVTLAPEEVIFLYTDGVTEANDTKENLYGEEKLIDVLANSHKNEPKKIIENVMNTIKDYSKGAEQSDDITMLAIQYFGKNIMSELDEI